MPVIGAAFLPAVDHDLGSFGFAQDRAVHVEHYPPARSDGFPLDNQLAVYPPQTGEVLRSREQFRLERLHARGQRRCALPSPAGADQPEGRVLGESRWASLTPS